MLVNLICYSNAYETELKVPVVYLRSPVWDIRGRVLSMKLTETDLDMSKPTIRPRDT